MKYPTFSHQNLEQDLARFDRIMSFPSSQKLESASRSIRQYYQYTNFFYRYFHSPEGAMHLPLYLPDQPRRHQDALLAQARRLEGHLKSISARRVLELGCGQGYNLAYLARLYPGVTFVGLDRMPRHIQQARRYGRGLANLSFQGGDMEQPPFPAGSFDLILAVESFCYVARPRSALKHYLDILSPGGRLVLFDAFRHPAYAERTHHLKRASELAGRGFAVSEWWSLDGLLDWAQEASFELWEVRDFSQAALPNLLTFQNQARKLLESVAVGARTR
ncbi:MAG: methyltransferase domain-containing protein [Bacteroidia bacterium]|nr:methyltransferase domain-containing protein [Bacteroidia bacterium]